MPILQVNELRRMWLAVYEARTKELQLYIKYVLTNLRGKDSRAPWDLWNVNIKMLLKKILHHEISFAYKTQCGSSLLQTEGKKVKLSPCLTN
jgi:hypothetical protein